MAKLLRGQIINDEKMLVEIIYNLEAPENAGLDISNGVVADKEVDFPEPKRGKGYLWYVNPKTKEQWYESYDRPLTPEEKLDLMIDQQQAQQEQLDMLTLDALIGGSGHV